MSMIRIVFDDGQDANTWVTVCPVEGVTVGAVIDATLTATEGFVQNMLSVRPWKLENKLRLAQQRKDSK